jgi:hypothetical protein
MMIGRRRRGGRRGKEVAWVPLVFVENEKEGEFAVYIPK